MFVVCLHARFQVPKSSGSLITSVRAVTTHMQWVLTLLSLYGMQISFLNQYTDNNQRDELFIQFIKN
jgi:hypothetical protein